MFYWLHGNVTFFFNRSLRELSLQLMSVFYRKLAPQKQLCEGCRKALASLHPGEVLLVSVKQFQECVCVCVSLRSVICVRQ